MFVGLTGNCLPFIHLSSPTGAPMQVWIPVGPMVSFTPSITASTDQFSSTQHTIGLYMAPMHPNPHFFMLNAHLLISQVPQSPAFPMQPPFTPLPHLFHQQCPAILFCSQSFCSHIISYPCSFVAPTPLHSPSTPIFSISTQPVLFPPHIVSHPYCVAPISFLAHTDSCHT